jgi:hypothetical protein
VGAIWRFRQVVAGVFLAADRRAVAGRAVDDFELPLSELREAEPACAAEAERLRAADFATPFFLWTVVAALVAVNVDSISPVAAKAHRKLRISVKIL